ncbi:O-methyltransferase [Lophium mytilinum]|uniref:O-methyltransferase n=1 Tax=Lophium mytilinum TaxID=390894 RepID=A0A6A6QZ22_9PEZI|nr:O-methyltransferase [Lophium mytilinum]
MEKLAAEVKTIASTANDVERRKIIDSLRELQYSVESPHDTLNRTIYYNLRLAIARVAMDMKLFETLVESAPVPLTVSKLAKQTGASPVLLGRLLRFLAAFSMVKEVGVDTFTANHITKSMSEEGFQAGAHHYFDNLNKVFQAAPDFLAARKYQDITDPKDTPFRAAYNTDLTIFAWAQGQPSFLSYFGKYLAYDRTGRKIWLDVYPFAQECAEQPITEKDVLLVDVGGGIGDQVIALKTRHPTIAGRVILQDIPETLNGAIPHDGIETMAHDFFQPQTIKGAKYYYLRNILHDWPDAASITILDHLTEAMSSSSILLIDEIVLPDSGVPWQAVQLDMVMMCCLGAMERTREQWRVLLEGRGLRILGVWTYGSVGESVVACELK